MKKQVIPDISRQFIKCIASITILFSMGIPGISSAVGAEKHPVKSNVNKLKLGMVVLDGLQLLDVFGPLGLFGHEEAIRVANGAEYEWNEDSEYDPFAKVNGLVD